MSSKADRSEKRFTKAEKSWIMYDWANSIYATNIMAAIFPIYFAMQADETGNKLYGFAVSAAALVVAVLAPILGGFILSRIGFSGSCLFYDSFLTDVTTPERMDRVSSWGYAMGYIGGSTIPFIISIAIMLLMNQSVLSYKIAIMIVVVWWAVFSIPFLKNVKQQYSVEDAPQALAKEAFRNAWKTFKDILKDKKILFFIIAYFFYIDGVDTIISMATNYGETLGLGAIGMILALLVTQIVAVPFSILFGNLAKKVGAMRMIAIAVCVYFVITILGFFMGFNIEQAELSGGDIDAALKLSSTLFWILATLVGTVQGGIQALSRSYFGQLIPPERSNEYYGFLDIFGKFSCVIGPALYAATYAATGRASLGILSIIVLFFGGMVALFAGRKYMKAEEK